MKKIGVIQSNYIPWKGYFDFISYVDEFILYDDIQFTKRDWRNRNVIKTPLGLQWLTVPVKIKGRYFQTIRETQIDGSNWAGVHLKSFHFNYSKAPFFKLYFDEIEDMYLGHYQFLSILNFTLIKWVCEKLKIKTQISNSWDYDIEGDKTERLVDLCKKTGATCYVSGPAAKIYLNENLFLEEGIKVEWFNYDGYPDYPQLWGEFKHNVTILDLLFNCGKNSSQYMRFIPK